MELILQQLNELPTLSSVAVRLLELTSDERTDTREVIKLVSSDPSLSAKILNICRCSDRGRTSSVTTVDKAVVFLGFDALRSAVLSLQVLELFDGLKSPAGEVRGGGCIFDRESFWQHSLAVAVVCESLAGNGGDCRKVNKADAYIAGLLHDLGVLALHILLPRSFDRVCQFADTQGVSLDQACQKIIGLDTHTAGRRLAEHWRLPHSLGDVMWLHGQRMDTLPDLPHRAQIALVTLADIVARNRCLAPAGHGPRGENVTDLCESLGLSQAMVQNVGERLHQEVAARAASIGLHVRHESDMLLRSISRANESLGRINAGMRQRALQAERQAQTLAAICRFHDSVHDSAALGGSLVDVCGKVVESAAGVFGGGFFAMFYQLPAGDQWRLIEFGADSRPLRSQLIAASSQSDAAENLADNMQLSMQVMDMLPWLRQALGDGRDLRGVHLLPLRCGWGTTAVLLHDCAIDGRERREQLESLSRTWAAAIAAAIQNEGATRLGEQLAAANRTLVDTQSALARSQALAAIGEVASGAAHEMNNPLTVISGRSQLLASTIQDPHQQAMARQIVEQSDRISGMITALRQFAEPLTINLQNVDLGCLLEKVLAEVRAEKNSAKAVNLSVPQDLPPVHIDGPKIALVVTELVRNAYEAEGSSHIEIRVQIDPVDDRLMVQIIDDGCGLSDHALTHAFEPFFSDKPAGRQPGLGLARARRLVEAHHGRTTLANGRQGGAVAAILIPRWRAG